MKTKRKETISVKHDNSLVILLILFFFMVALLITIIILNIHLRSFKDWNELLFNLMDELLSSIIIGLFIGLITKMIVNKLFSVEINMKKMRQKGITSIGDAESDREDIRKMFGCKPTDLYPYEIKLMFLTGNVFLRHFESRIIECLDQGTTIKLLITSYKDENKDYLIRTSKRFTDGTVDLVDELLNDSIKTIKRIKQLTKNPQNFNVRFYRDEYQNNIRISKYWKKENKELEYYWINVQPISKVAIDLSITLKGYIDSEESIKQEENIYYASEKGFDNLWLEYNYTENEFDEKQN